jgi:hypothetical protein
MLRSLYSRGKSSLEPLEAEAYRLRALENGVLKGIFGSQREEEEIRRSSFITCPVRRMLLESLEEMRHAWDREGFGGRTRRKIPLPTTRRRWRIILEWTVNK